jgi:hypothetical protein
MDDLSLGSNRREHAGARAGRRFSGVTVFFTLELDALAA